MDIVVPSLIVRDTHSFIGVPEADALALPGFTFGLDIVILVGQSSTQRAQNRRCASITS